MAYEYKVVSLKFKSAITGKMDIDKIEEDLNHFGKLGFRLKLIDGISLKVYLEKNKGAELIKYEYHVTDPEKQSRMSGIT